MTLIKVKDKYQVTLPISIRKIAHVAVGDILEAKVADKKITLTPKAVVDTNFKKILDQHLAEGLEDIHRGRGIGPFSTAKEAIRALHAAARKHRRK